jgi:Glyoxalase-like domain
MAAIELDHVLIAVTDLAEAERTFAERYGLASIEGGRHPGWGTANRIIPLGDAYLELIAVVDESEAATSALGRWVAASATESGRPLGWAVRTSDLDDLAQRLGESPLAGSRATPAGETIRWRTVGLDQAVEDPSLPFFIERSPGSLFPGTASMPTATLSGLDLQGSPAKISAWLGDHALPIRIADGSPGITRIELASDDGEIVVEGDLGSR